ncbi:MAG: hypothetical protein KBB83_01310 [Alphaproteobacteria bacterium]|nr:hypothetical protein [Alphaproteobacteria bacterium]
MTSGYLKRTCVRVVLFAHLIQIFTPAMAQASDTDYQYRVKIQTLNLESEQYFVEVSRRKKDKSEAAQVVQRLDMEQGKIKDHFIRHAQDGQETLYDKFAGAVVKTYEAGHDIRFVYDIPGLGQIQMLKGGKAFLTQEADSTSLSKYGLAIKSSGDLLIARLKTAELVLRSLRTELDGDIVTEKLRVKHEAVNRGNLQISKLFEQGTFTNQTNGKTFLYGDACLKNSKIINEGAFVHTKGKLELTNASLENRGNWLMEEVSSVNPLMMTNHGLLQLKSSSLNFSKLINNNQMELYSGQYSADHFENTNVLGFLERDWVFTDVVANTAPHRFFVKRIFMPSSKSLPEYESQKNLTYDVATYFGKIRAEGDVLFSKKPGQNFGGIFNISTPGKVSLWAQNLNLTRDSYRLFPPKFEFPNIGHLELNVEGPFTCHFPFKAPRLTLNVNGPLTLGKSNEELGTIAATHGPLTVNAHSIDGKYGKFYGYGRTTLEATKGDILIGAAAPITGSAVRVGAYTMYTQNGAYVASNDVLTLRTPANIFLDYGCLISNLQQNLLAKALIRNTAGRIAAGGPIFLRGDDYLHTRGGMVACNMDGNGYGWAYSGFVRECPLSGPASIESKSNIIFDMTNVRNVASNIFSGGHVYVGNKELLAEQAGAKLKDLPADQLPKLAPEGLTTAERIREKRLQMKAGVRVANTALKLGSYTEEAYHMGPTATHDRGSRGKHWGNQWVESCAFLTAEGISINMGSFSITGLTNSPFIQINVPGTGYFGNASNTRTTLDVLGPRVVNVTKFVQDQARRPGFMKIDHRGEVRNEFPMGCPFIPASGDVVLLQNPEQPPLRKFPINPVQFFNPICGIDIDLFIQQILSLRAGQVYAGKAKGNQSSKVLWGNGGKWALENGRTLMTEEELANTQESMLLMQATDDNTQGDTLLVLNPKDISRFQSDGDTVCDKFKYNGGGNLDMVNNRLVINDDEDTTIKVGSNVNMTTTSQTRESWQGNTRVVEQVANPQQVILKPKGKFTVLADGDINRTGSHIEAGGDVDLLPEGHLREVQTPLSKFTETKEEKHGLFSSSEGRETTLTHSAVPTTTISGGNIHKAGAGIHSISPQDYAEGEIHYDSPNTVIEGLIALNRHTSESSKSNGFTEQSTSKMQESAFGLPANLVAKKGVRFTGEAKVNANITTPEIHDETESGVKFVSKVVEVLASGQSLTDSPLCSVDAGYKAGYETMMPCMLMVEKIIRTKEGGEMLFESVLMDDRAEIIGKFVKTTYELKQWQTSWCHVEQVVPNEVIIAAAIAITILTKGAGAKVMAPLIKGVTAATGMALSPIGITMVNAGFSAFCAAATSNTLRSGDPIQVAKQMVSLEQLKSIGITMASAGLCSQLGGMLDVNMEPGIKELSMHLKEQALRGTVDTILNVSINQTPVDEALSDAVKQIPLKAVAAYAANQICWSINEPLGVKALHTALGGLAGFAMEGNRDGVVAGATGALTAQVVGDILMSDALAIADAAVKNLNEDGKPLTPENVTAAIQAEVNHKADLAKIAAVGVAALLKKNPNTALFAANNIMDNDITIRQSIYVMAELQKLLAAAAIAQAAVRVEEPKAKPASIRAPANDKGKEEADDTPAAQEMMENPGAEKSINDDLLSHLLHGYQDIIWELSCEKTGGCEISAEEKMHGLKKEKFPLITKNFEPINEAVHNLHELEHDQDEIIKSSKSSLFDKLIALVQKLTFKEAFEKIALPSAKFQIPIEVAMHLTINQAEISSILSSVINNKPIDQQAWDQVSASVNELGHLVHSRHIIQHKFGPHTGHGHGKK